MLPAGGAQLAAASLEWQLDLPPFILGQERLQCPNVFACHRLLIPGQSRTVAQPPAHTTAGTTCGNRAGRRSGILPSVVQLLSSSCGTCLHSVMAAADSCCGKQRDFPGNTKLKSWCCRGLSLQRSLSCQLPGLPLRPTPVVTNPGFWTRPTPFDADTLSWTNACCAAPSPPAHRTARGQCAGMPAGSSDTARVPSPYTTFYRTSRAQRPHALETTL